MGKPIDLIPSSSCRYPDDIPVTSLLHPHYIPINWLALHTRVRWILCIYGLAMGQGQRCRPVVVTLGSQPPVNCTAAISPRQSQQDVCLVRTPWPVGPNIMQLSSAPELQGRRARAGRGGCGWLWMAVDGCGWLWMAVDVDQDWRQNLPISNSFFFKHSQLSRFRWCAVRFYWLPRVSAPA